MHGNGVVLGARQLGNWQLYWPLLATLSDDVTHLPDSQTGTAYLPIPICSSCADVYVCTFLYAAGRGASL